MLIQYFLFEGIVLCGDFLFYSNNFEDVPLLFFLLTKNEWMNE